MDPTTIAVLAALFGAWTIQGLLSLHQMGRFHRRSQQLRRQGSLMATGRTGTTYRRRVYGVLVVDDDCRVVAAEQLSGWTIAARLKPVPEVVGLDLDVVGQGEPPTGVTAKQWAAFDNAADFIRAQLARRDRARPRRTVVAASAN